MKRTSFVLCFCIVLAGFAPTRAWCQGAGRVRAPYIPAGVDEAERAVLLQCQSALSEGKFDQVTARLTPLMTPPAVSVFVDWAPVPAASRAAYRQAVSSAISSWNSALAGSTRFQLVEREDAADLRILFERGVAQVSSGQAKLVCADLRFRPGFASGSLKRRACEAWVAINLPYSDQAHSAGSISHLAGKVIGLYLGLTPSSNSAELMGPDSHEPGVSRAPSSTDTSRARELQQTRFALMRLAQRRVAAYLPKASLVLDREEIDAGEIQRGDKAHFEFHLKNRGDAPLELDAKPSCGCTVASFDRVIAPGAEGKIVADLATSGFRGKVTKLIDIQSNDPAVPQRSVRLLANVLSAVTILPSELMLVPLRESGPTVRELEIRTSSKELIEVTRVATSSPYVTATLSPMQTPGESGRSYRVEVTIKPDAPLGRSTFAVTAFTSSAREPGVNVTAICDKGIFAVPALAYLGNISVASRSPISQTLTIERSEGSFRVLKVTCDDPKLDVKQETLKEGKQYRLTVSYRGGWTPGTVRGKISVETDDPVQSRFEIPVMATVTEAVASH